MPMGSSKAKISENPEVFPPQTLAIREDSVRQMFHVCLAVSMSPTLMWWICTGKERLSPVT